ncbi:MULTISPECIES: transposase family protein [unclassified Streptomyces]|uniref:transposase family protein n=1 Tax=unclassified Streptomyces TaxID=2593676 RepID=UPI0009A11EC2|nr:transposase family protein [Streptomyces sp. TSRI0107]
MVIPLSTPATEGALLVPYPAMLDVPHELVEHVAWLLREHRRARNTRWRKLGCFQQALLTLVHLRKNETLDVLAGWAPGLHEALTGLGEGDHVIVDGTLIPIDRIRADAPYYSMKHRRHGMNAQVIARPDGTPLWFSRATPGRTHDLTSARAHGIVQACLTRQILVLADRAYQGAGATFRTPYYRHREQPEHYQQFNRDHARLRAWRLLRRARCSTRRISTIVQAVHTLLTCNYPG